MAWFDGGDDNGGYGGMMPSVQQAYARDPRQMMIQAMMAGVQEPQGRVVSPLSVLSRALSAGLAGYSMNNLNDQYQTANQGAQKAMQDAMKYGSGYTDETGKAIAPDQNKMISTLMGNPYTSQKGMEFALSNAQAKSKARSDLEAALMKEGMALSSDGTSVTRLPGWGGAKGQNEQDISFGKTLGGNLADIQTKPQLEALTTTARNQAEAPFDFTRNYQKASGTAAGGLPYAGAEAAAKYYAVPHEVGPGSSVVQIPQPGPAGVPSGGLQPPPLLPGMPSAEGAAATPAATPAGMPTSGTPAQTLYANPNPSPGTQPGELDKYYTDIFKGDQDLAGKSRTQIAAMTQLSDMLDGIATGKLTPTGMEVARLAKSAGIDPATIGYKTEDLGKLEAAQALARELSLSARNFPGAVSDYEQKLMQSMTPGIEMTPEGRKQMLDIARARAQRNEEMAQIGRDILSKPGNRLDVNFLNARTEWAKRNGFTGLPGAATQAPQASDVAPSPPTISDIEAEMRRRGLLK